jgi:hypothetical protein
VVKRYIAGALANTTPATISMVLRPNLSESIPAGMLKAIPASVETAAMIPTSDAVAPR